MNLRNDSAMKIVWEQTALEKFEQLIARVPIFLREIAREKITSKAQALVVKEARSEITEKDMVDAFFAETPFGFHGPMKNDMQECGIDFTRYGYER